MTIVADKEREHLADNHDESYNPKRSYTVVTDYNRLRPSNHQKAN
jgi:hypothetical protein